MKQTKRFILSFLTLMLCTIMYAQSEIKGTVNDAMGPVIGATVMEKGTSNGTVTDFDGNFTLKCQLAKRWYSLTSAICHRNCPHRTECKS